MEAIMDHGKNIEFLEKNPGLNEWLRLNGFWMVHSAMVTEIDTIMTFWTDQCKSEKGSFVPTASDRFLIIAFCKQCGTIEIYDRGFIGTAIDSLTLNQNPFFDDSFTGNIGRNLMDGASIDIKECDTSMGDGGTAS